MVVPSKSEQPFRIWKQNGVVDFIFGSKASTRLPVGVGGIDERSLESAEQDGFFGGSPVEIGVAV